MQIKKEEQPQAQRKGWLKNGNPPGDFSKAPRCGAKTRKGTPCKSPAMASGRCRMHGGKSPGAPKGNRNAFKHGMYTKEMLNFRKLYRQLLKESCETLEKM